MNLLFLFLFFIFIFPVFSVFHCKIRLINSVPNLNNSISLFLNDVQYYSFDKMWYSNYFNYILKDFDAKSGAVEVKFKIGDLTTSSVFEFNKNLDYSILLYEKDKQYKILILDETYGYLTPPIINQVKVRIINLSNKYQHLKWYMQSEECHNCNYYLQYDLDIPEEQKLIFVFQIDAAFKNHIKIMNEGETIHDFFLDIQELAFHNYFIIDDPETGKVKLVLNIVTEGISYLKPFLIWLGVLGLIGILRVMYTKKYSKALEQRINVENLEQKIRVKPRYEYLDSLRGFIEYNLN